MELDEITMKVFGEIASSEDPNIDVEIDYPSKYPDKMMPILDMKMKINSKNEVVHAFFRKPFCTMSSLLGCWLTMASASGQGVTDFRGARRGEPITHRQALSPSMSP